MIDPQSSYQKAPEPNLNHGLSAQKKLINIKVRKLSILVLECTFLGQHRLLEPKTFSLQSKGWLSIFRDPLYIVLLSCAS